MRNRSYIYDGVILIKLLIVIHVLLNISGLEEISIENPTIGVIFVKPTLILPLDI